MEGSGNRPDGGEVSAVVSGGNYQKNPSDSHPRTGLEAHPGAAVRNVDDEHRPVAWQATNNSSPRNAMAIGWLPTLMAVCSRKDGSIKLTVLLFRLLMPMRL